MIRISKKSVAIFIAGGLVAAVGMVTAYEAVHYSSTTSFCISCHEMRVVAEQGWMRSPHYHNPSGVVAQCSDCHVPPETDLTRMLWVKARDGSKDVFVHTFGEADPRKMDWEKLEQSARSKIHDSSCVSCHHNITAQGVPLKAIQAHREYQRMAGARRCVDCHMTEFHGGFRQYLFENESGLAKNQGGVK